MPPPWCELAYVILSGEEITNHCEKIEWRKPSGNDIMNRLLRNSQHLVRLAELVIIGQTGKARQMHMHTSLHFGSSLGNALIRAKYCVTQQQQSEIRLTVSGPTGSV